MDHHAPVGDELIGYGRRGVEATRTVIPLRDVLVIAVKRPDHERPGQLVVAAVGVVGFAFMVGGAAPGGPMLEFPR